MNIVVLTGAGISAESGLKTFRDNDGLWEGHRVEEVATPEAFRANPQRVQDFYNQRREQLVSGRVVPNAAHQALAEFEKTFTGQFTLITQNIDNLHQLAGSRHIYPMHGELLKSRCVACNAISDCSENLSVHSRCAACDKIATVRPHIVWFGEMPLFMDTIDTALSACDVFVSIGTSGVVYPAAGFRQTAAYHGAKTVELNLVPSETASLFDEVHYGKATEIVPRFFNELGL